MTTAILGLGNVLMGDDAFGPWVISALRARWCFPDSVVLHDLGTPGYDLLPFLADADHIVLIDTVRADAAPGAVRRYDRDALLAHPPTQRVSPHDPGVKAALLALEFAGRAPTSVLLVGVVPDDVSQRIGLSPALRHAADAVEQEVLTVLRRLGHDVFPRTQALPPDRWWELPQVAM